MAITGVVVDADDHPIAGAAVAFLSGEHPFPEIAAITDGDGSFALPPVLPGRYVISARSKERRTDVVVQVAVGAPSYVVIVLR